MCACVSLKGIASFVCLFVCSCKKFEKTGGGREEESHPPFHWWKTPPPPKKREKKRITEIFLRHSWRHKKRKEKTRNDVIICRFWTCSRVLSRIRTRASAAKAREEFLRNCNNNDCSLPLLRCRVEVRRRWPHRRQNQHHRFGRKEERNPHQQQKERAVWRPLRQRMWVKRTTKKKKEKKKSIAEGSKQGQRRNQNRDAHFFREQQQRFVLWFLHARQTGIKPTPPLRWKIMSASNAAVLASFRAICVVVPVNGKRWTENVCRTRTSLPSVRSVTAEAWESVRYVLVQARETWRDYYEEVKRLKWSRPCKEASWNLGIRRRWFKLDGIESCSWKFNPPLIRPNPSLKKSFKREEVLY